MGREQAASSADVVAMAAESPGYLDTDAVVIGNGPSGLLLSALLGGHTPVVRLDRQHPDVAFDARLHSAAPQRSGGEEAVPLWDFDVRALACGLEGRTSSELGVLLDMLHMPGAERGLESPQLLELRHQEQNAVRHIVLGPPEVGGLWRQVPGEWLTLSPGSWMGLPGLSLREWLRDSGRQPHIARSRIQRHLYVEYLEAYVERMGLAHRLMAGQATRVVRDDTNTGWVVEASSHSGEEITIRARSVILACGAYSIPGLLGVPGEGAAFVSHRQKPLKTIESTILVVGAGMSAADCIVDLLHSRPGVIIHHSFRARAEDTKIGSKFGQGGGNLYPEYGALAELMSGKKSHPQYKPWPQSLLAKVSEVDQRCIILSVVDGGRHSLDCNEVRILIGGAPNLDFIDDGGILQSRARNPTCDALTNGDPNPHPIFVDVDPMTLAIDGVPGIFAVGPLRGANFVRYIVGDAVGAAHHVSLSVSEKAAVPLREED